MKLFSKIALVGALLGCAQPAFAQDYSWATNEYSYATRQLDNFTNRFQDDLVNPVQQRVRRDASARAGRPNTPRPTGAVRRETVGPVLFARVSIPADQSVSRQMASAYPAPARAQVEAGFNEFLVFYGRVEQQFGIPRGDIGGALAAFLVGNLGAMTNRDIPDANFMPVVLQMRSVLGSSPQFQRLSNRQKQEIYEQLVISGMLMAATQMAMEKQPNPEIIPRMRAAGRENLVHWFGNDVDALILTSNGLEIRARN